MGFMSECDEERKKERKYEESRSIQVSSDSTMLNLVREQNQLLRENNRLLGVLIKLQRGK